ncbi:hypothetical protein ACOSQ2_005297 [Xanthoceras sorbifolium]
MFYERTKHIDVKFHFVRDIIAQGQVTVKKISTHDNPVDMLTKSLSNVNYVVDATDYENLSISRSELHDTLSKPSLNRIPLLVLGSKIDKPEALGLNFITDRGVCCFMISCKNSSNIDVVIMNILILFYYYRFKYSKI